MTAAPHSIDPATYLDDLLAQASPDLMRRLRDSLAEMIFCEAFNPTWIQNGGTLALAA